MLERLMGKSEPGALPVRIRVGAAIVRGLETVATGIYALAMLAAAVDWGLDSVLPVEEWTHAMNRRAAERGAR